jgi:hypothetical protein
MLFLPNNNKFGPHHDYLKDPKQSRTATPSSLRKRKNTSQVDIPVPALGGHTMTVDILNSKFDSLQSHASLKSSFGDGCL